MKIGKRNVTAIAITFIFAYGGWLFSELSANFDAVSAAAEKAKARYLSGIEQVQANYSADAQAKFAAYLKELEAVQDAETKAGRLEVALAVRDEIKRLQTEGAPVFAEAPPTSLRLTISRVVGTWHVTATTGARRTYIVDNAGKVRFADEKRESQLKGRPNEMTLDFGDGKIERWTLCGDRLFDSSIRKANTRMTLR